MELLFRVLKSQRHRLRHPPTKANHLTKVERVNQTAIAIIFLLEACPRRFYAIGVWRLSKTLRVNIRKPKEWLDVASQPCPDQMRDQDSQMEVWMRSRGMRDLR